jgi:uncharacterized phage protein (TIGR01671 family)
VRAIKFRAWHKQEKKMYEVTVIRFGVQHGMARGDLVDYVELDSKSRCYVVGDEIDLLQFIGLADRNEKEIYDGDILDAGVGMPYQVIWDNDRFAWMGKPENGLCYLREMNMSLYEIVGNIYENKDLLKK